MRNALSGRPNGAVRQDGSRLVAGVRIKKVRFMEWQLTPFAFIYLATALLGASVAWLARKRRTTAGADALSGLMVATTLWALADGLESMTLDLQTKIFLAKVSHLGIQAVAPLFLVFVLRYTHRDRWLTRRRLAALWIVPVLTCMLVFSNERHQLIWSAVELVDLPYGLKAVYYHGVAFWLAAAYSYTLLLAGTLLLLLSVVQHHDVYRRQASVLVAAVLVPWIGNITYLSGISPLPGLDYTSISFVVTGVLVAYAIFYLGLLDLAPVARNTLFERMSDALLVIDSRNRVVDANPAACDLLHSRGPVIGSHLAAALGDAAAADLLLDGGAEVHRVIALGNGEPSRDAQGGMHPDARGMDVLCTPLYDETGRLNGRLIVLRDITERLRMEQELRRSEEHYRSFLATVSHELRTPLTGILGMAEALQAHVYGPLTDRQLRSLQIIEQSGRHLNGIINDMLDLSRLESSTLDVHPVLCSAADLCQISLATVQPAAQEKRQEIEFTIRPESLQVTVDPQRFVQVLCHLLDNAVKFTPREGKLGLDACVSADGLNAEFCVWDTGIGIAPEAQARLFQPFTQVDARLSRTYGGAGLGLALVRRLVELHGGAVTLASEPGHGSRFTVIVPYAESRLASAQAGLPSARTGANGQLSTSAAQQG